MLKDTVISFLAAVLTVQHVPWFAACQGMEKTALIIGIMTILIIFCLFLENLAEKWRKYSQRVQKLQDTVRKLRNEEWEMS